MYKRILRVGQNWTATNPDNTQVSKDTGKKLYFINNLNKNFITLRTMTGSYQSTTLKFQVERNYILDETKTLFRKNAEIKDVLEANERFREAEARLAMAEHYK